jgi:anti-sigma B factor antagonist
MEIDSEKRAGVTVLALDGSIDGSTAPEIQQDLKKLLPEKGAVLLDMSRVSYMSSAGLRVLLLVYRDTQDSGAQVALASLSPDVRDVMAATGFLDFFSVFGAAEEAVRELSP